MYPIFQQIFVCILYTKLICHGSFNYVYKMYRKVCQNVVYILYTSVVYILYNFCMQNVYTVSVWAEFSYDFNRSWQRVLKWQKSMSYIPSGFHISLPSWLLVLHQTEQSMKNQ